VKRFFLPGKRLIDRLTYPKKMAFMALVFSVPVAVFLYLLASGLATDMALAKQERTGLEFNRSVAGFLRNLQQHRGMASAYLHGDASFRERLMAKRSEVDESAKAVSALDGELGEKLGTGRLWRDVQEGWLVLKASFSGMTAGESFEAHTELAARTLEMMRHVADLTRPSLRTGLDAYHLTDALVLDIPLASEYQGRIRGIGAGAIVPGTLGRDQRHRLLTLAGLARQKLDEMEERFGKAFGANPRLAERLQGSLGEALTLGRSALTLLQEEVIAPDEVRIGPAEYFDAFTRAIDASFRLHGETATALGGLLREQEDSLRRKMYLIGAGTLAAALLLLYLFAGSYLSVMNSLSALVSASRRIGRGDTFVTVSLEARDEMTQVAESFNEMAGSIAGFTAELTSANEALRAGVVERKGAEENLRASEEQYRVMTETSSRLHDAGDARETPHRAHARAPPEGPSRGSGTLSCNRKEEPELEGAGSARAS
jgi:methyl-accepting chemotaxis protein